MGGEKFALPIWFIASMGSPPRGRGKVPKLSKELQALWITPAWAGKSIQPDKWLDSWQDHPRVGGEKSPISLV